MSLPGPAIGARRAIGPARPDRGTGRILHPGGGVRVHTRTTWTGWLVMGSGSLLIGLSLTASGNEILPASLPLGLAFLLASLAARLLVPGAHRQVEGRWILPRTIHAQEEVTIGCQLQAPATTPPGGLLVPQPQSGTIVHVADLPGVARAPLRVSWVTRFPRRGLVELPPLLLENLHPFGLVAAIRPVSGPQSLLVLPALGQVQRQLDSRIQHMVEEGLPAGTIGDDEFDRLRPYRLGDSWRRIHWRASARARRLLTVQRQDPWCRRLGLVVDAVELPGQARRLERLISIAASLVEHLGRQGWELSLHGPANGEHGNDGDRSHLQEILALLKPAPPAPLADFVPAGFPCLALCLRTDPDLGPASPLLLRLDLEAAEELVRLPQGVH